MRDNNSLDRELTSVTQPDGQVQTYDYDPTTGQLETATIPGAGIYTFGYDTQDRLSTIATTGGFGSVTLGYDGPLVTSVTTSGPQAAGTWSGSLGGIVQLGYDNAFEVSSVAVQATYGGPNGFSATYVRDDDDLVTSIAPTATSSTVPTFTLDRSPLDGRVTSTTLGVVTTEVHRDVSATTPGHGDVLGLSASVSGTEIYGTAYQRDHLGRITQMDEEIGGVLTTRRYEYDGSGRLWRVRDGAHALISEYLYDGNGARTSAATPLQNVELGIDLGCGATLADPVDGQDRLCRYGDFEYAYDDNGRLATKTSVTTSDVTTYAYDGLGRLRAVELPGGQRIDYVLDAKGRRLGKVVDGVLVKGWLYGQDSLRPIAQLDEDGEIEATFVYETGVNVPDYIVMTSGAVLRVIKDHLGSVRLVVNVSSGTVAQRIDYDEFGVMTVDTNPGFQPFGFAGGLYDADTGLVRFGARDYDPVVGRWTAKDPSLFRGGLNLYGYANNDPINFIDPDGRDPRRDWELWDRFKRLFDPRTNHWNIPDRDQHCGRNQYNRCPTREPNVCGGDQNFRFDAEHGQKYRSPDGSECKYDSNGNFVDEGSYNFTPDYSESTTDFVTHGLQDVLPDFAYGKCYGGDTTLYFR